MKATWPLLTLCCLALHADEATKPELKGEYDMTLDELAELRITSVSGYA